MNEKPVTLKIFRYDPAIDLAPFYKTYEIPWQEGMLLLPAVKYVRDNIDETLAFRDYCCGCSWCMSCLMMVNGKGMRTCSRVIESGESILLEPMRGFPVIKDLVVDFGINISTPEGVFKKMEGTVFKEK
jgi:fumarate reductase (CoM/CoB) subunit B